MERRIRTENEEGVRRDAPTDGDRKATAGTVMEVPPEALAALGLSAPPAQGESLEIAGRAVSRGLSRRGGAVLQIELTGLEASDGASGGDESREREAFFRSLFNGDG